MFWLLMATSTENDIIQFFVSKLQDIVVDYVWFQQYGATCHTARETIQLLPKSFTGRVISHFGEQNWGCQIISAVGLFSLVYLFLSLRFMLSSSRTPMPWWEEIERCINEIQPHLSKKVLKNFSKIVRMRQKSRGVHLPDILFHT